MRVECLDTSYGNHFGGFGYTQKKPTEIWEDNASCIMMSENPTNRDQDMSMSRYTISVTWFETAM